MPLADEQRDALTRAADAIANLDEAVEHLSLAWFRGYSHVQPIWGEDGEVREIALLDSWHFLRAPDGRWLWNPECRMDEAGLRPVGGEERLVSIARRRAIDYPALAIYIRHALAERDWGRFLERYGIPPVDAVMSPDATMANRADYLEAAERARDGLPVVWPGGSQISRAEGSRGQDPFSAFVRHQEELIVLMATGGTLTSLAEAGSGTLAGGAQMDVWEQIVRRDAQLIGAALQRGLFARALEAQFPGRPVCASFELGTEAEPSPSEVFDLAAKARAAGYVVAQPELEEATGYKLAPEAGSGGGFGGFGGFAAGMPAGTPLQSVAKPLQNAASAPDDETPAPEDGTPQNASYAVLGDLAESLATDMSPAAERVAALLEMPEAERAAAAAALLEDLPGLLPDDPQMAAILAEAMAGAFAGSASTAPALNGNANRETDGRFAPDGTGDRTGGAKAEEAKPDKSKFPQDYESDESKWPKYNAASPEARKLNQQRGRHAILKSLHEEKDVANAMHRDSLGPIDFPYGKAGTKAKNHEDGYGVSKIAVKHPEALEKIPGVIAHGRIHKHDTEAGRFYVVSGRNVVILSKKKGANAFLVTGFDYSANRIAEITKNPLVENKGVEGGSDARLF